MMYIYYEPGTGAIIQTIALPPSIPPSRLGDHWIEAESAPDDLHSWMVVDGELTQRTDPETVARLATDAIAVVNTAVGALRSQFITNIPGQEMLYLAKEAEAGAYLADPDPDLDDYPLVSAEVGITAATPYEVAQVYLNLGAYFRTVAAQLETLRLGYVTQLEAAATPTQVEVLLSNFHTALEGLT